MRPIRGPHWVRLDPYLAIPPLLGLLAFSPFFARGLPNTADGMLHLYRSALWIGAWQEGVLWPRWHTALYFGFGYPLFNFAAPLLYTVSGLLASVLPSAQAALKGALLLACIACPLGMYLWVRDLFGRLAAVVAAAACVFATYRVRELFIQGNYAQYLSWALYPWVFFTWRRLAQSGTRGTFLGAVVSLTALLLAHNISAMLFAPFAAAYVIWQALAHRKLRLWGRLAGAAACAGAIALAFWWPALVESADTHVKVLTQGYFAVASHVIPLADLGAATALVDGRAANPTLPYNFGRMHLALALVGALGILRPHLPRAQRNHLLFALAGAALAVFMMLEASLPVWSAVPFLPFAEFPTRYFGVAFLFTSLLAGASLDWLRQRPPAQALAAVCAVFGLILAVANGSFPRPFLHVEPSAQGPAGHEEDYRSPGTTSASEYLGRWTTALPGEQALSKEGERRALIAPPPGMAGRVESARATELVLAIDAQTAGPAPVAQFYFPGWQATVNGAPAAITPCTPAGLICVDVSAGASTVTLTYAGTNLQRAAGVVGLLGLASTVLALVFGFRGARPAGAPAWSCSAASAPALALAVLVGLLTLAKAAWIAPYTQWFRITSPPGAAVLAQHSANLAMGPNVRLIGWDLPQTSVRQGDSLRVRLYWQATAPLDADYTSFVQLIGGSGQRDYGAATSLHPGNIPTSSWTTDYFVVDEYMLKVAADTPPMLYTLRVGLSPHDSQERIGEIDLAPRVRVRSAQPVRMSEIPHRLDVRFGDDAKLLGYAASMDAAQLHLNLFWRAGPAPGATRQIFVHLLDAEGTLIAQADGGAFGGDYVVGDWEPGVILSDDRTITLPPGEPPAAVLVGLYDLQTQQRVPAVDSSGRVPDNNAVRLSLEPADR